MENRFRLKWHDIESERHPTWQTQYIQTIEIVDSHSGLIVETIEGISKRDGQQAANEAGRAARAWIANQRDK